MSDKKCCVPGCAPREVPYVLHGFPNPLKDRERFNMWLMAICGDIVGLEDDHIYKYRRVCRRHFEARYLCRNNRISNAAVPTLHLAEALCPPNISLNERRPLREVQNTEPSISRGVLSSLQLSLHERRPLRELQINEPLISNEPEVEEMPSSSNYQVIHKTAHKNLEPEAEMPSSSNSQLIHKTAHRNLEPEVEEMPSSSNSQVIHKTAHKNLGGKRTFKHHGTLSPKERALQMKIVATKIKVSKLKNRVKKQLAELKSARKFATNPDFLKVIESCSSTAKLLFQMQWRESKKNKKGRRFTLQEKIVALSILKQSPKGYRFFRKIFLLPAPQTLTKLVQKANLQPGINKNIFAQMKTRAASMKIEEKLCVLLYDEVSLKANLSYNSRKGRITGFVDNGHETKPDFANHAQVFMVRGLIKNYKQPVAYTFSACATKGPELAKQIKDVVTEVQKSGLILVATVCDQGSNNRQAVKVLMSETRGIYLRRGETPKDNIILINNKEIVPLYDPPHLLKGMRNNLMTKDLYYEKDGVKKVAKWSHINQLHQENPGYKGIRLIPKLTENHVNPEKMNKMKVKYASQIFSRTVASNMGYLADKGILQAECKETADFIIFMDNLFDSVNGSYLKNKHSKPLLGPATPNSVHMKTWRESKKILASMKFMTALRKKESVPSVQNWVWTLEGMEVLLRNVANRFGVTSVWLRHLNQDPLENFFGAIRSHGCRNINPTCDQFESAFVALLINNLTSVHTYGKNCEDDFTTALHALVIDCNLEATSSCDIPVQNIMDIHFTPLQVKEGIPSIIAPLQYVSGYLLKKAKTNIFKDCAVCKNDLSSKDEVEYIKYREYAGQRWLCYPSNDLMTMISNSQDIAHQIFQNQLEIQYLRETITTAMYTLIDFQFINCDKHKTKVISYMIDLFTKFMIFTHCKNINKILSGRREVDDDGDMYQLRAKKLSSMYKRCISNK